MNAKFSAVLLICILAFFFGCGSGDDQNIGFIEVTDITDVTLTVVAGVETILTGTVIPENAKNKTIAWSVKNAGETEAVITGGSKLKTGKPGNLAVTASIANGTANGNFTKDFDIVSEAIDALEKSFDVVTTGGANADPATGKGNIIGNSLAWINDAKPGSVLKFYMSSTVYPTGHEFQPQAGSKIAVIGNSSSNVVDINIPETVTPGAGRSVTLEIPITQVKELLGTDTFLAVDVLYGRINACELLEPRRYQAPLSDNARRLMNYFTDIYGEYIISGQMDTSWSAASQYDQLPIVFNATGKYPALKGFDLIQHRVDFDGSSIGSQSNPTIRQQTLEALDWWNGMDQVNLTPYKLFPERDDIHGIIVYCWHWRGPDNGYYGGATAGTPQTTLRIPMIDGKLNKAHANFAYIKGEIDKAIVEFKYLQERNVPIIWRPLHEALGNTGNNPWFWWGVPATDDTNGRVAFRTLWEYMYDYMTLVHGLDNLIWLNNGQGNADNVWVPDSRTFHLTGYDRYPGENVDDPQKFYFDVTKNIDPSKMVAMSENGPIPNPDKCREQDAMWLFFMVWDRMFTQQNGSGPGSIGYKAYNHEKVITFDKLPDLTAYRLD